MKERFEEERLQKKKEEADEENKKREEDRCEKERHYLQEQSSKEIEIKLQKEEEMCKQEHEIGKQLMEDVTDELTWGITENNMQLISEAKLIIQIGKHQIDIAEKEMGSIRKQQKIIEEKKSRLIDKAAKPSASSRISKTCSLMSHSPKGDDSKIKMSSIKGSLIHR